MGYLSNAYNSLEAYLRVPEIWKYWIFVRGEKKIIIFDDRINYSCRNDEIWERQI